MGLIGLQSRAWQGCFPSGSLRDKLFPYPLQLLEATLIPWLMVPSSVFKASDSRLSPSHVAIYLVYSYLPPAFVRALVIVLGLHG